MNNSRTIDIASAAVILLFCLLLHSQLDGIPVEGLIFPMSIIYLLMGCGVLLAGRALIARREEMSFFGEIPPARWCVISAIYLLQALGAMYVSFRLFMSVGMFVTLFIMEEKHSLKGIVFNALFVACFMAFFQFFFTGVMHIYFPEPLFE